MRQIQNFAPRPLAALCILLGTLALAPAARATIVITVNGSTNTYEFGLAACNAGTTIPFTYDFTATSFTPGASGVVITAYSSTGTTCTAGATTNRSYTIADQTATSATIDVPPSDFLGSTSTTPVTCASDMHTSANPGEAVFCVQLTDNGTVEDTGTLAVEFAMSPPAPPTNISVSPGDQQLHVSWTAADSSDTIATYQVYCEPDATDGGTAVFDSTEYAKQVSSGTGTTVASTDPPDSLALVNGDSYSIAISATDSFGNTSAISTPSTGNIPEPVADFYTYYRNDGGSALGCASAEGTAWIVIAAVLLISIRGRRSRKAKRATKAGGAALLIGLGLFASPQAARADDMNYNGLNLETSLVRQDRRFFFALELDRYSPAVDSEKDLNGATPYRDIFGHRIPWRVQGEFDWEALHLRPVGTLLVGGSIGFWQNIGKGIFLDGPQAGQPSSDTTLLDIWPFGAEAIFRFDGLTDKFRWFPIIPYAKVGLMAALWVVYAGNGAVANSPADPSASRTAGHGAGWTPGYTTALGLALSLDAIDPSISNEAYLDLGLQRTSVFAEYGWTRLDDFQQSGALILTARNWRFGLSLEF